MTTVVPAGAVQGPIYILTDLVQPAGMQLTSPQTFILAVLAFSLTHLVLTVGGSTNPLIVLPSPAGGTVTVTLTPSNHIVAIQAQRTGAPGTAVVAAGSAMQSFSVPLAAPRI
jgi:hypothetical protein